MAPNTRGNPKAGSSSYEMHKRHSYHHHSVSWNGNSMAHGRNEVDNDNSQTIPKSDPVKTRTLLSVSTGKRKHDDVSPATNHITHVSLGSDEINDRSEQQVGLKLLFAASVLQSKQSNNIEPSISLDGGQSPAESLIDAKLTNISMPFTCSQNSNEKSQTQQLASTTFKTSDPRSKVRHLVDGALAEHVVVSSPRNDSSDFVAKPTDLDVLCGRGGLINKHPGNIVYRRVVDHNKTYYKQVPKRHRILVSQSIVQTIQTHGGRFLQSISQRSQRTNNQEGNSLDSAWITVSFRRAVQKTSQALREPSLQDSVGDG